MSGAGASARSVAWRFGCRWPWPKFGTGSHVCRCGWRRRDHKCWSDGQNDWEQCFSECCSCDLCHKILLGRGKAQHRAAKYFFDLMPELGIQPNVITFSSLMRTYTTASLKDILAAYEEMKRLRVEPNNVLETYLIAVFQGIQVPRSPGQIAEVLRDMEVDRLRAARDALKDFEEARVRLGFMSIKISKALNSSPSSLGWQFCDHDWVLLGVRQWWPYSSHCSNRKRRLQEWNGDPKKQ